MPTMLRPAATAGITLVGAGLIAATPLAPAASNLQSLQVQLTSVDESATNLHDSLVGMVVGGTGIPIPQDSAEFPQYVEQADSLFIQRVLPGAVSHGVFTPEGGSPIYTGVKSLPFNESFAQGTTILTHDIEDQVNAGNTVAVYGESQSSTIAGMVMPKLEADGIAADKVHFVLVGDPSNPDGGLLERFAPLQLPALGIDFGTPTPADSIYQTDIYTQEYDGFADFPKYTLNVLSDLNAFLGIMYVHPTYRNLTEEQIGAAEVLGQHGNTTYHVIPLTDTDNDLLPLLRPLAMIPGIGKPLADLLNPDLTQLVNLGYDNPDNNGWDVGHPDVPTGFGLFPELSQVKTAFENMGPGTKEGIDAFIADLKELKAPAGLNLADLFHAPAGGELPSFTDVVNGVTAAMSDAYQVLLPTADIITSLGLNMPAYDAELFFDHLSNPLEAIGMPLAADTGLITLAAGIEFMTIEQAVQSIIGDLSF